MKSKPHQSNQVLKGLIVQVMKTNYLFSQKIYVVFEAQHIINNKDDNNNGLICPINLKTKYRVNKSTNYIDMNDRYHPSVSNYQQS